MPLAAVFRNASAIDARHHVIRVSLTCCDVRWEYFVNARQIVLAQRHIQRTNIFFKIFSALRARDGHNVISLRHHPGQGKL